ncbi:MAG: metal ABC transporter permease [Planctomycetes bacterium]|nr:metal ABC transporter permease [Planctomycetota bacterium]
MSPSVTGIESFHLWNIATAMAVAAPCALVGTLLVARRLSLLGDAIAHAVLPGIVIAVLAGGRPGGWLTMIGAVAAAIVTASIATAVASNSVGVGEDAATGVGFTTMFALGVILVSVAASRVDLDTACVLYGELELSAFDTVPVAGLEIPRGFITGCLLFAGVGLALCLSWKEQVLAAFDPAAARALGLPVAGLSVALLVGTALTTVAGFDAVGGVLVVTMLVAPAAAAELLVSRLHHVAAVAVAIGMAAGAIGYLAAWRLDTGAAGMIAVVLGAVYAVAALVAPEHGILARALGAVALRWRVAREDFLAAAWRAAEGGTATVPRGWAAWPVARWLAAEGAVGWTPTGWRLTPTGRARAETIVRSHRLWEAWLGRNVDLPLDHLHPPAEWVEHHIGSAVRAILAAEVGDSVADPHGRSIPPESPPPAGRAR